MKNELTPKDNHEDKRICIFSTNEDQTVMDISQMSDFISTGITRLANNIIDTSQQNATYVPIADMAILDSALKSSGIIIHGEYEYILDFDSLPKDILKKYREGKYKLGESRQVKDNLRATIVDESGTRVKDVTLKKTKKVTNTQNQLQNIAIQMQLKQIIEKLDTMIQLQDYHIDFSRNNALVKPFFDARDHIVYAQNESDKKKAESYIDQAIQYLGDGLNAIYLDLDNAKKHFLWSTRSPIRIQFLVDRFIRYITQDLHLLSTYNGVLFQLFDYRERTKDLKFTYEKYRGIMADFYTKAVGRQSIPLSLQVHNAIKYSRENLDAWKKMTDDIVPALMNPIKINSAYIIEMEGDENVK